MAKDAKLPLFLRDYINPFQTAWWADRKTLYVQFRNNADEPGYPIGAFVDRVKKEIAGQKPKFVVLDLRLDQGGNFTSNASLMKHIADDVERVYMLTSAWTFSAGNVSLALAKFHGGGKVTIVGEPVGDRMRIWAEGNDMVLPNSKLDIGFATGLHDYTKSCFGEPGCFWVMYLLSDAAQIVDAGYNRALHIRGLCGDARSGAGSRVVHDVKELIRRIPGSRRRAARLSPFAALIFFTVPSRSAFSTFSIFIASTTASISPACTCWPSVTLIDTTRPGIGQISIFDVSGGFLTGINAASAAMRGRRTVALTIAPP